MSLRICEGMSDFIRMHCGPKPPKVYAAEMAKNGTFWLLLAFFGPFWPLFGSFGHFDQKTANSFNLFTNTLYHYSALTPHYPN